MNMGLTLFKRKQRYQGGSEAVPSDLPTPPEPPEAYQSAPVRSLIDQVRQGILPDEALNEIRQNPTSLKSLAAYAGAALSAGTLLSGGDKPEIPFHEAVHASKPDIVSGAIPNVRHVAGRPESTSKMGETLAHYSYEDGQPTVTVHDGFFDLTPESKASLLSHELGHEVSRRAFMQSDDTTEALRPFRVHPDDKWNYDNFGGFSRDPGEMIADVYAQAMSSKKPLWESGGKYDNFQNYVLKLADEGGLPTPDWYKSPESPQQYVRGTSVVRGYPPTHMLNTV